jgi:hypothetical protein
MENLEKHEYAEAQHDQARKAMGTIIVAIIPFA